MIIHYILVASLVVTLLPVSLRAAEPPTSLVIVIDGLRPDYITPEIMPKLHALGAAGVVAEAHHAVFPTVTRVNASSLATGAYPGSHGLMNNTIYLPAASPNAIDTGDAPALIEAEAKLGGNLLTAVSIAELFARAGKTFLVAGSGTSGSSHLLNHRLPANTAVLNSRDFVRPASLRARADAVLGLPPATAYPNPAAVRWAVDAWLELGLKELRSEAAFMWLTDPDGTAHRHGVGTPRTIEALRGVDAEVGRLLAALDARGLRDRVNLLVTADHGFSTHGGPFNLNALLTTQGLAGGVRIVSGGQIYVESGGDEKIRAIVQALQAADWVGAIFTRAKTPGSHEGFAPGTLSLDAIHHQHPRAPDILVDPNWSHAKNPEGYAGKTTAGGVAGHGSSSPYDIRLHLIASGPAFKRRVRSTVPTGNIDLAVTLCHLHGIAPAPSMTGRVLKELLRDGPDPDSVKVERSVQSVSTDSPNGRYQVELHTARVGTTDYVGHTETTR